jgi:transketolase
MRRTCLNKVHELATADERVIFVGSDLGPGVLEPMKTEFPDRFFMEGIAEQNVIGMAAGLALEGFIPFVNTIATFITRRCFEQVAVDLCLHDLPVRLIGNGGGLVYAPLGPTHLAIEDMAIMRALPNMCIVAPADADEMVRFMEQSLDWPGPIYIRLAKGGDPIVSRQEDGFEIGKAILLRQPGAVLIAATGATVKRALDAADILAADGLECGVLNIHTIKPLDTVQLCRLADQVACIFTVEEHVLAGGLGSAVIETLSDHGPHPLPRVVRMGIPDVFPAEYGSQDTMFETFGIDAAGIASTVRRIASETKLKGHQ